jgi:hypothetical protein
VFFTSSAGFSEAEKLVEDIFVAEVQDKNKVIIKKSG